MATYDSVGLYLDYTPSGAKSAGDVVVLGSIVGVVPRPIAANALGSIAVGGVWKVAKNTGIVIGQGDKVYYYSASGAVTAATGTAMGFAAADAATGDATVDVLLQPGA